jgi:DNA-binding transcriptional MerR regulator
MDRDPTYDLQELCTEAGVTPRTVRYYIQQGLLPAPEPQGPSTRYGQGHLDRLRLIRDLQAEHQPLAVIRQRLEELGDEDVRRLVRKLSPSRPPSSAVDYVRSVLGETAPRYSSRQASLPELARSAFPVRSATPVRAQWERLSIAPDVELHVRRPLTRENNRRVEKLLALARQIFEEDRE